MSGTVLFCVMGNVQAQPPLQAGLGHLLAVLECGGTGLRQGDNSLYLRGTDLQLNAVWRPEGRVPVAQPPAFEYRCFSAAQRAASRAFCDWLCTQFADIGPALACGVTPARITPTVAITCSDTAAAFHHFAQQGELGGLFVRYGEEPLPVGGLTWESLAALLQGHAQTPARLRPALGDECWYTKWRPDLEMERKFTFAGIPDTWRLLLAFHDAIAQGQLPDFVPEIDREIQVWDYEQHIFEVLGANAESGYIAYIPQADGRMTVKRKWFIENSEIRRESLFSNQVLAVGDIEQHARTLTPEAIQRLPSYRRTRFDAQFESLRTGNIFGIYMDVCRTLDNAHVFSQCEVEYCRTRSFGEIRALQEDFDAISNFVGASLVRWGQAHQQDLFSKLDFVRGIGDAQASRAALVAA